MIIPVSKIIVAPWPSPPPGFGAPPPEDTHAIRHVRHHSREKGARALSWLDSSTPEEKQFQTPPPERSKYLESRSLASSRDLQAYLFPRLQLQGREIKRGSHRPGK